MKRNFIVAVLLAFGLLEARSGELPPDLQKNLIFYAAYTGSAEANFAKGKAKPVTLKNVTYEKALHGQGMYVGAGAACLYETAGNLNNAEGTLSMWLIPKGWVGGDSPYIFLFETGVDAKNRTVVFKQSNYNGYFQVTKDGKPNYCGLGLGDSREGEPLHLVCTWGAFGRATYVDGQKSGGSSQPVSPFGPTFSVGCSSQPGYTIVDEVHIFNKALTGDEVVELFKATEPESWKPEAGPK